jgi:uncharacterized membrane protein YdfJ with MMPL/SSD domain
VVTRNVARHPRIVLVVWGAIVALAIPLARHESDHLTLGGYAVSGSQSSVVGAALQRDFPELSPTDLAVLLWPSHGATATEVNRAIHRIEAAARTTPHISITAKGREEALFAAGLVGPIIISLQVHVSEDAARNLVGTLRSRLGVEARHSRVELHLLGESALAAAVAETSQHELATAERISFPLLLGVLLLVFGSLTAAVLPVALGATSVVVAASMIYGLSHGLELSVFTANTASMFGIGVAVDYSLLVLARLRQELGVGRPFDEALTVATATAGRAVVFSGAIVVTSLAGVWLVPIDVLRSMAAGAMIVVAVSVVASITLLPALIVTLGETRLTRNFLSRTRPRRRRKVWRAWARTVTGHPFVAASLAGGVLLLLAAPALQMTTSTGTLQQLSKSNETRIGFTEAAKQEGPGALGPVVVTLEVKRDGDMASLRRWAAAFHSLASKLPGVRESSAVQVARSAATFFVVPITGPESAGAQRLVQRLRRSAAQLADTAAVRVAVGGAPGSLLDEEQAVRSSTWKVLAILLVTSFVILFAMLRSVLLPVKAVVMNLLSVGAAYGALVIIFQWGWLDTLFHYQAPGHIYTLVPPLVLAVVFGLSMDYEVFLLTRIRECWLTSGNARGAVAEGLEASARTIASAAFILVSVFAVFVGTGVPTIKELGVGAGVAVAVDATLIRLILVPATMELFGAWNWWMPRPLDRILPRWVSVRATAGRQTQQAASAREAA